MMIIHIILKILGYLLLFLLLVILIVCLSSIRADISFWNGKFEWCIRYFGFRILPRKKKKAKKTETSESSTKKDKEKKSEEETEKSVDLPMMDKLLKKMQKLAKTMDMAGSAVYALPKTLQYFGKALTWYHIETDILVANEDAAVCAQQYGIIQTVLQTVISQTGMLIHVKRKKISIQCDFTEDNSRYDFRCSVKIHIGKTLIAGIVFLIGYLKDSHTAKTAIVKKL